MANRFEVDKRAAADHQRAALFNSRFGSNDLGKRNDFHAAQTREMIERQNDQQIAEMQEKVGILADITKKIGQAAKDSNGILSRIGSDFDRADGLLKGTLGSLKKMMDKSGGSSGHHTAKPELNVTG